MFKRLISKWNFEIEVYFAGVKAGKELMNDGINSLIIPPEYAVDVFTKREFINGVYNGMKHYEG